MDTPTHIRKMVERIVEAFAPLQVLLFGSQARGTATDRSDVDLIVVFADVENNFDMAIAIRGVLIDAPLPKDIVVTTPEEIERRRSMPGDVLHYALPEARVLYDRDG